VGVNTRSAHAGRTAAPVTHFAHLIGHQDIVTVNLLIVLIQFDFKKKRTEIECG
jgi:hypothetical protein